MLVAETVQELHAQKHGRTRSTQPQPFHGVSCMSVLVQASCQEHTNLTEAAAAVVAVVKAVASALALPVTPEEAAVCACKVNTPHTLKAQALHMYAVA